MEEEIWGIHPGTKRKVSSLGRIEGWRIPFLKHTDQSAGYLTVTINKKTRKVHRLVAETFLGEIPEGMHVNHKDGNKLNNILSNLEIVTPKENNEHATRMGLMNFVKGSEVWCSKLSDEDIIEIYNLILSGKTNSFIGEKFDIYSGHISSIRHGHRWKHLFDKFLKGKTIGSTHGVLDFDTKVKIVLEIKAGRNNCEIAAQYGTCASNFSRVRYKKIWKGIWQYVENQESSLDKHQ